MQQQRQEIYLGKQPLPRPIGGLVLILSTALLVTCGLLLSGKLSETDFLQPGHDGKSGFAQVFAWLIGLAIVCPVFLLTRRQHGFTLTGQSIAVRENGQLVWEQKCIAWRWRSSDKKNILGVELLDDQGAAYLVRLGGLPLGTREPFAPLIEALDCAKIPETETNTKPLPFAKDVGAWLAAALALVALVGFSWLVWAGLHAFDGIHMPGSY
ncbi:hypothetical protein [Armatimonas rosea]|uniref:Uncharacterized protein n=1 Tax=Armatimonas rosea TaxID=685828 RepID=A0A7W9ST05_ARMRO|nr:hypothetical protein [Armatimonas rosea]MBB6052301.1 hypothetical protein [Armatimonas rosea]